MKHISLTRGLVAIVDDEDFDAMIQFNWFAEKGGNTCYAVRTYKVDKKKINVRMHRVINNTPDNLLTDHINGDGLDNRRVNLRAVTHQENMINCARWKVGSSKYRGVSWHVDNKKWYAQITINYKNIYVGTFETELEAHVAYEAKRAELRAGQIIRKDNVA